MNDLHDSQRTSLPPHGGGAGWGCGLLFTQIRNEWRANLWLALELLIVSVVLWYILDLLYSRVVTYLEPRGFDIEHCYLVQMGCLTDKSPDYIADYSGERQRDDIYELCERLRRRPEVEAVSLSHNSYPYNGSNSGFTLAYDTLYSNGIFRHVTPDFVRVFRYTGVNGETPERLAELLRQNDFLGSENLFRHQGVSLASILGDGFYLNGDTVNSYNVGASLNPVRYSDFQEARWSRTLLVNIESTARSNPGYINPDMELCVRVRADQDRDFIHRLKADSESQFRVGNIFIADVRSFADIRRSYEQAWINQLNYYVVGMGFLLLNIFLGLLGTFWFRTQQRRGEIALHKVHGATNRNVFARLLSEGMGLLLLVTPLAIVVEYFLTRLELNAWHAATYLEPARMVFCIVASFLLCALMIAVGIWYPASRAMKVQPAEALHDE